MQRVTGIGGIFFKAADPKGLGDWYAKHLGLPRDASGYFTFPWRTLGEPSEERLTAWSTFRQDTDYFAPSQASFMVNYIVEDLDALLAALREEGVWIDEKRSEEFGRFAWVMDPEGNRIELWEPSKLLPQGT